MEFNDVRINGSKVNFVKNKKQLLLYEGQSRKRRLHLLRVFPTQRWVVNWDFNYENINPKI
jgi:hypothetical protein